jgi:hypothetical protein
MLPKIKERTIVRQVFLAAAPPGDDLGRPVEPAGRIVERRAAAVDDLARDPACDDASSMLERMHSDYKTHRKHKKRKSFLDELFD